MTKNTLDQNHQTAGQVSVEPDNLPVRPIAIAIVALVFIVAGTMIAVNQLYWFSSSKLIQTTELDVPNRLLTELKAEDQQQLTEYGQLDKDKGIYRLPIDEAMKLYVKQNAQ
jgi:hypothetical protein